MKFFENKKILKKIALILLMILLFQFGSITPVRAAGDDNDDGNFGIITGPIVSFIIAIGDRNQ